MSPATETRIKPDGWLAELMQCEVFRVDAAPGAGDAVRAHYASKRHAFYFSKIDTGAVATVTDLCRAGGAIVDVNVGFAMEPAQCRARDGEVLVRECTADDEAGVLDVAGSAFKYSRFHLDPRVPDEVAHLIKREWIQSYVRKKRGDHLFAALVDGRAVGFLASIATEDSAIIDLIAVDPSVARRRVGQSLIAAFARHYAAKRSLQVGTQVANVPSVRLYEKTGFSLAKSDYVVHLHVRDGHPE